MATDPLRPLVDAAVEGDDRAVAELVRRTQADIWRVCRLLGSGGDEADLVQDTYLRALGSLRSYRGDAPVRPWLLSIARRVCADAVRRRQRQRRVLQRLRLVAVDEAEPSPDAAVDDLLAVLAPERREAFVLTQLLGLSYAEAAVSLDCPIGTVRSRVARARADLIAVVRRIEAV